LRKHPDEGEDKVKTKFLYNCRRVPAPHPAPEINTSEEQHSPVDDDDAEDSFSEDDVTSPDDFNRIR
jgi:hypothetical protein